MNMKYLSLAAATGDVLEEKMTLVRVFSCGFCKIPKNTIFAVHLWETASVFM